MMIQDSPFITLCMGSSIELDRVISEPCYKGLTSYKETIGK